METKNIIKKHILQSALETLGIAVNLNSYSGRGMFGKRCLSIQCDNSVHFAQIMFILGQSVANDFEKLDKISAALMGLQMDSLGQGIVAYFPDVPFIALADG